RCTETTRHSDCRRFDYRDAVDAPRFTRHVPSTGTPGRESASSGTRRMGERLMIPSRRIAVLLLSFSLSVDFAAAQSASQSSTSSAAGSGSNSAEDKRPHIAFNNYVTEVLRSNLSLSVQRANIAISQAGVTTASVTPDWSVDVGLPTVDLSNQGNPTN